MNGFRKSGPNLIWEECDNVSLENKIIFSKGYDFFGIKNLAQKAKGTNGNYYLWPNLNNNLWSLYRDTDGSLAFERYKSESECKAIAEKWCKEKNIG